MPSPRRWLSILTFPLLLAACDDRGLRQRAEQIRQLSDKEDRDYASEALHQIKRTYWTARANAWLGKLPDGTIVRLDGPRAAAAPLPSRAFYTGWHLQLTLSSDDWRTFPDAPHEQSFRVVYAITRHSATSWEIRVTSGPITSPLHREDILRLQSANPPIH